MLSGVLASSGFFLCFAQNVHRHLGALAVSPNKLCRESDEAKIGWEGKGHQHHVLFLVISIDVTPSPSAGHRQHPDGTPFLLGRAGLDFQHHSY